MERKTRNDDDSISVEEIDDGVATDNDIFELGEDLKAIKRCLFNLSDAKETENFKMTMKRVELNFEKVKKRMFEAETTLMKRIKNSLESGRLHPTDGW